MAKKEETKEIKTEKKENKNKHDKVKYQEIFMKRNLVKNHYI